MVAVTLRGFRGMVPRLQERALPPQFAQRAVNCRITSGALDPLEGPEVVTDIGRAVATIMRYRHFQDGAPVDNWLTWPNDVDAVLSPLANDERGRVFFTSANHEPHVTDYELATADTPYPDGAYALGLPLPPSAPTIGVTGGTAPQVERAYAVTFVDQWSGESGPSPASAVFTGNANGTWNLTNIPVPPASSGSISATSALPSGRLRLTLDSVAGLLQHHAVVITFSDGVDSFQERHRIAAVLDATDQIEIVRAPLDVGFAGSAWARETPYNTITVKRIYRSAGTLGRFLFVAEIPAANTTYDDTTPDTGLAELIATQETLPPPGDLRCLVSMPNGCLAGLSGNELCLSDPYRPDSWPLKNRYSFSGRGVSLIQATGSLIILTDGFPILYTGVDPEAMSPTVMETVAPCVSKRGAVSIGGGALYPSNDGLWVCAPGRIEKITRNLFTEKEFGALSPASFVAEFSNGRYYATHDTPRGKRILILDVSEPDSTIRVIDGADAWLHNVYDGELYLSKGSVIYRWDADTGQRYVTDWLSAETQLPQPTNFQVAQVHARYSDLGETLPPPVNNNQALMDAGPDAVSGYMLGDELLDLEVNGDYLEPPVEPDRDRSILFTLYYNNVAVFTRLVTSPRPFKLPARTKGETVSVGIGGGARVFSVRIAESLDELRQTP